MKLKDQERALAMIDGDPGLHSLRQLRAPYLDLEVRRGCRTCMRGPLLVWWGWGVGEGDCHLSKVERACSLHFAAACATCHWAPALQPHPALGT